VLVRLRKQIKMPAETVTRKMLAERSGVSSSTLRQIEIGALRLTSAVAQKIFRGTGVSPDSLMRGDDPLLDPYGVPLGPNSFNIAKHLWVSESIETNSALLVALFHAAEKRSQALAVSLEFYSWIEKVSRLFGLDALIRQQLADRGKMDVLFVPFIPDGLRPKDPESKRRWKGFQAKQKKELEAKLNEYLKRSSQRGPRSPGRPVA
jgi:transcriptional regulator with XRE-family HTH domain